MNQGFEKFKRYASCKYCHHWQREVLSWDGLHTSFPTYKRICEEIR